MLYMRQISKVYRTDLVETYSQSLAGQIPGIYRIGPRPTRGYLVDIAAHSLSRFTI